MSSAARRLSNERLAGSAIAFGCGLAEAALPERHEEHRAGAGSPGATPTWRAQAPEPHEPLGVLVAERVTCVVGGEPVLVER